MHVDMLFSIQKSESIRHLCLSCVFFFVSFFSFQSGFILLRKNEERNIKKRRKNAKNNNLKTMLTFTYISSIEHLSWLCDKKREKLRPSYIYIYTHTHISIYIYRSKCAYSFDYTRVLFRFILSVHPSMFISCLRLKARREISIHVYTYIFLYECECLMFFFSSFVRFEKKKKRRESVHECVIDLLHHHHHHHSFSQTFFSVFLFLFLFSPHS